MADSNSLMLLPPRQTAQLPHTPLQSQPTRSSSDDSFEQKLEKAKSHKAHSAQKKQDAATPTKATPVKTPVAKAAVKVVAKPDSTQTTDGKKSPAPRIETVTGLTAEEDKTEADHAATTEAQIPVAEDQAITAEAAAKKSAKNKIAAKPAQSNPNANPAAQTATTANQKTVNGKDAADDDGSPDDHPIVAGIDSSDDDTAPDAKFGTGKLAARANGQDTSATTPDSSTAADAAGQTAAAASVADASPADEIATIDSVVSKIAGNSASPASAVTQDGSSGVATPAGSTATGSTAALKTTAPAATPQAQFVEDNHPKIVSSIQGQLMPHGGTMQLRLDPPDLGALQVTVHLKDGVMTASFETSNDEATKLLSHSLGQLKAGLEAAGVSVDKIHVEQSSNKNSSGDSDSDSKQAPQEQQQRAQQDQQRREMVQRMWRKLAGGGDPLDMVA